MSGEDVVSGTHLDCDTCVVTGSDDFTDTKAKWMLDSSDGYEVQGEGNQGEEPCLYRVSWALP